MGSDTPESKYNKFIDFSITLEKICYFPGENINGSIYLIGKPGLNETQLTEPKVLFQITEKQRYNYSGGSKGGNRHEQLNRDIFNNYLIFNNFMGANLLIGITIPFSIQLPLIAKPSLSINFGGSHIGYIKHFLTFEIPCFKIKRIMTIIVKNIPNFTSENKLLKIPCVSSAKKSKSKFLLSKGDFSININLTKNVFYYDEPIPYEIKLDCKNLDLVITKLEVSLLRHMRQNHSSNLNWIRFILKNKILSKIIPLNQSLKEHIIQDVINYPKVIENDNYLYPPKFYSTIESNEALFPKKSFDSPNKTVTHFDKKYLIAASCINSLVSVDYIFEIKLYFETFWTLDEKFEIPIDFCSRPDERYLYGNQNQIGAFNSYNNGMNNANQVPNQIPNMYSFIQPIQNQSKNPQEPSYNQSQMPNNNIALGGNENIYSSHQEGQNININESGYIAPPPPINNNYNPNAI